MRAKSLLPYVPYVLVGAFHLATLAVHDTTLSTISKWFLMPALILAILLGGLLRPGADPGGRIVAVLALGVAFSWAGDVMLNVPGDIGFLIGLGAFFLAHVTYLVLFVTHLRVRRVPWQVGFFALWWLALVAILAPHAGVLLVPVALYGLVLGASASASLACNRWVATGGILFLISDTILAFKLFWPTFELVQADLIIMVLYLGAQGFIVFGATR